MAVFLRQCHFQNLPLLSQKSQLDVPKIVHCLASPGKVSALALKNEDSMNKEKHSLRYFVVLQSGEATQRNSSIPQSWLLIQKSRFWKWHCLRTRAPGGLTLTWIYVSSLWCTKGYVINKKSYGGPLPGPHGAMCTMWTTLNPLLQMTLPPKFD